MIKTLLPIWAENTENIQLEDWIHYPKDFIFHHNGHAFAFLNREADEDDPQPDIIMYQNPYTKEFVEMPINYVLISDIKLYISYKAYEKIHRSLNDGH